MHVNFILYGLRRTILLYPAPNLGTHAGCGTATVLNSVSKQAMACSNMSTINRGRGGEGQPDAVYSLVRSQEAQSRV